MTKPFDISKYRKTITTSIPGIATGFNDPKTWISTGNYCLNYLISGDFYRGIPLSKVVVFAGESGSGKSYVCSGNVVRNAQQQGIFVVLIDTENALDEDWLKGVGVDCSEDKLLRISLAMVDDVAKVISDFMAEYKKEHGNSTDAPKVLFVIDSLGMLLTKTDVDQFDKGDLKGDMGRKAKSLFALVKNSVNLISPFEVGILATNHTYASQDMFDPDDKISGGNGFIFASSIVIATKKKKLKEDENGVKTKDVAGIKATCKVVKTRFAKPFESVDVYIPYASGMDPYSGLFDLFVKTGIFQKVGNRYSYKNKDTGEDMVLFRKHMDSAFFDLVMKQFSSDDFRVKLSGDLEEHEEDGDDDSITLMG